jgi:hypothetical protein
MERQRQLKIIPILFSIFLFLEMNLAHAFTLGKTYDSSNWQEIADMAPPFLLNWVKKGEFILQTSKLNFDFKHDDAFLEASKKNIGKFALDEEGILVDNTTGKRAEHIYGFPFAVELDPRDPQAAQKIMYNFKIMVWRWSATDPVGRVRWIGEKGREREVLAVANNLYYLGRPEGPIPNPNNHSQLMLSYVVEPFDLRGMVQMSYEFNDEREDMAFAYVPMIRRMLRVSAASKSDPFLGSDLCMDDSYLWAGKNQSFDWKLTGEMTVLAPFTQADVIKVNDLPEGGVRLVHSPIELGCEVAGWRGASWAPVNIIWSPRPVWIVEGMPKDPYYNYGRQLFYADKEIFMLWFKEIYDRAGQYWKGMYLNHSFQVAFPSGRTSIPGADVYSAVDEKMNHATVGGVTSRPAYHTDRIYIPLSQLGPDRYTISAILQLSK